MGGGWALGVGLQGDARQQGSWANSPALGGRLLRSGPPQQAAWLPPGLQAPQPSSPLI